MNSFGNDFEIPLTSDPMYLLSGITQQICIMLPYIDKLKTPLGSFVDPNKVE